MKSKRILIAALALLLGLSAVSCRQADPAGTDTADARETEGPDSQTAPDTAGETQPPEQKKTLKVLATGHSNIATSVTYLTYIAKDLGTDMLVGLLWRGDSTFGIQANLHATPKAFYFGKSNYSMFNNITVSDKTYDDRLVEEDWDIITINQGHLFNGYNSKDDLPALLKIIRKKCPDTPIYNNISLAFMDGCPNQQFQTDFGGDADAMFDAVLNDVKENIAPNPEIAAMIPTGTLIKSLTTSKYRNSLYVTDKVHLGVYGAYAAGVLWYAVLTGESVEGLKWMPAGMDPEFRDLVIETVPKILAEPYQVIDFGEKDGGPEQKDAIEFKATATLDYTDGGYFAKFEEFVVTANDKGGVDVSSATGAEIRCIWAFTNETVESNPFLNYSLWDGGVSKICVTKYWNDGEGDIELPVDVGPHSVDLEALFRDIDTSNTLGYTYVTVYTSSTEPVSITRFCLMKDPIAG